MTLRSQLEVGLVALGAAAAALWMDAQAAAQAAQQTCPPGQPCVVVVPQPQQSYQGQVVVQPYQAQGQVVVQPYQAQGQVVVQPYQPPQQQVVVQPYQQQPYQGYQQTQTTTRRRMRWALVGPGIGLIVGGWVGNWITGAVGAAIAASDGLGGEGDYAAWGFVPLIGPWIGAAYWVGYNDRLVGTHALWGILQGAGFVMCLIGTLAEEEETVNYVSLPGGAELALAPYGDQHGGGIALSLTNFDL